MRNDGMWLFPWYKEKVDNSERIEWEREEKKN